MSAVRGRSDMTGSAIRIGQRVEFFKDDTTFRHCNWLPVLVTGTVKRVFKNGLVELQLDVPKRVIHIGPSGLRARS